MSPYAEAGNRGVLFASDVKIDDFDGTFVIEVKPSLFADLLYLHETNTPMTLESDKFGTIYKNGDPTINPVSIPKSAIFETIGKA